MFYKILCSFLVDTFLIYSLLRAQDVNNYVHSVFIDDIDIEDQVNSEEDLEIINRFTDNYEQFININQTNKNELSNFLFLNSQQVENILAYVYQHPLKTVYELQLIDGLDKYTIDKLVPLIVIKDIDKEEKPRLHKLLKYSRHELSSRFDYPLYTRRGYINNFLGPSWYSNLRYSMKALHYIEWGLNLEKDSGEPFFALDNRYGYDYISYYITLSNIGILKKFIIGNYNLNFGEGLIIGGNSFLSHTFSALFFPSLNNKIKKHSSNDEYNYFSGVAATLKCFKFFEITPFYSFRKLDGKIVDKHVETFYKNGIHQTSEDFKHKKKVVQQVVGGNISFEHKNILLGVTFVNSVYNYSYCPLKKKYNIYYPRGKSFYNIGLNYQMFYNHCRLKGEIAKGKKGVATINSLLYHPKTNLDILLLHRYYAYNYWGILAKSYGVSNRTQNENGWTLGCLFTPSNHYNFYISADIYSSPWWRYRISKPSKGFQGNIKIQYHTKFYNCALQYSYKQKERDVANTNTKGKEILPTHHHKLRGVYLYQYSNWLFKSIVDYIYFKQQTIKNCNGFQLTQRCELNISKINLSCQGTFFNASDYDARVYVYEKGVLYNYNIPSFTGKGYRLSCVIRSDISSKLMIMAKWSDTHYFDRNIISSGNNAIYGREKMDIQFFIRLKL